MGTDLATLMTAERLQAPTCKEGWIVFRTTPWAVLGPYARFEDAVWRAASAGPSFRLAYGAREGGECDFVPTIEPRFVDTRAHRRRSHR